MFWRSMLLMLFRLNWLFFLFIYLSVNGQVFATSIHICSEMAMTSSVLSSNQVNVKIHDHHPSEHHEMTEQTNIVHGSHNSATMDNCQCVDCDCVQTLSGQANPSLLQKINISDYLPVISTVLTQINQDFISLPHSNPFRPPIKS